MKRSMRSVVDSVFAWPESPKQSSPHRGPPSDREREPPTLSGIGTEKVPGP